MVSVQRTLSSAEQSVGTTGINLGTRPVGMNAYHASHPVMENALPDISFVGTGAGEIRIGTDTMSVMDHVFTTSTLVMESVRAIRRAAATIFVFLMISLGGRITTGCAEIFA